MKGPCTTNHSNLDNNTVSRGDIGAIGNAVKFLMELEKEMMNSKPSNSHKFMPLNIEKVLKVCVCVCVDH